MRISDWSSDVCSSDLLIIANACQAEQIGRKLRTFGMEDERPAHAENPTEKASFEHDIVSGRSQTRLQCGCWRAGGCPVGLTEDEGRDVNLAGKLQKAFRRGGPGIEECPPGLLLDYTLDRTR